jgi:tRNA A-37 threonylcarbamoyl transferase component Bud32
VPLLVCSSCHAPLPQGTAHCPRCGPGSLALLGTEALAPPREAPPGALSRLGRALGGAYRVVRLIGRGGFAEVYEVTDTTLQRRLAVKVLRSDIPWSTSALSRFTQETRAIARLNHPNTIPIHFVGEAEGLVYYAMPFLEGRSLADLLRAEGPLPVDRALGIVEPILEALQHAHEHGLVHRDVKPDNIVIEAGTGRPLLVDFGIVKNLEAPADITEAGYIVGTPLYMSPEQALGSQKVDARSDIYGIGAVLFHLLTGAPPFPGEDSQEIVGRHISEPLPVASLSRDRVPPWLSRIVVRCMAKHPDDRYPTARALLQAIREGRASAPDAAGPPVPPAAAAAAPASADDTPTERFPAPVPPARPRRLAWRLAAGGMAAAVLAASVLVMARAASRPPNALIVRNHLLEPIVLTVEDSGLSIGPGQEARVALSGGRPLEAHWAMVQPSHAGRILGRGVEGAILGERIEGERRERVDASVGGVLRFAPLVVNRTRRPLSATVIAGDDSVDCGCTIEPGDSLRLGYYPLGPTSAVRVADPAGRRARYNVLLADRDSLSGSVRIPVVPLDLAEPDDPAPAPKRSSRSSRAAPDGSNPAGSFLPVR